jgi:hypothetical protein
MTIDEIKENLPDVKVKIGTGIFTGILRGRFLPYAQVWVPELGPDIKIEYSWKIVQQAINNNKPLKI